MSNVTIQARISPELKKDAEAIFAEIGLKTSEAIRIFLKQTVNSGGLPFQPHIKTPNNITIEAMNEDIENLQSYKNSDDLFEDEDI